MQQHKSSLNTVVIGSGVAGLAAAIRLASAGHSVSLYEKNSYAGGKISAIHSGGFQFDAGPSLFTQPQNIEELFAAAGEPIEGYFKYARLPESCRYFFANGKQFIAVADAKELANDMALELGENADAVLQYLQHSSSLYKKVGDIFLNHSLHKRKTWFSRRVLNALPALQTAHLFNNLNHYNQQHFTSKEAVQIFDRFATYNGSNPYAAPAMLSLISHIEFGEGVYYPQGGMLSITNALVHLAKKKGVQFHFEAPVQRIIESGEKVTGIVAAGKNVFADVVVANMDVYYVYKNLLRKPLMAGKIRKQERSSSAFIFYWGLNRTFPQLSLHNIFFSADYQNEFRQIFQHKNVGHDATVYVNITSKYDAGHAPAGGENWFVMLNVPSTNEASSTALVQRYRKLALKKISESLGEDIEPYIVVEHTLDPYGIQENTGSFMGSLYGTSSNSRMAAFKRHPNFSKQLKGLYFVGGSVHPGGGIPLCFKSAKIAAGLIQEDFNK